MEILSYEPSAECAGCDKTTECFMLKTEAWTAAHCAKCAMKEAKKRSKNGNGKTATATLFEHEHAK